MDILNKEFVDKILEKYKQLHHIDESKEPSLNMVWAKISAEIFALSFNALIKDGYFHTFQNESSDKEH